KSDKNLKETLNIFEIKPNIHFLKNKVDQTFGNVYVFKNEENLKFRVNNYTLCIFTKNQTNICDFLYIKQLKEEIKDIDKFSAIFYDEQIKDEYLKNLQESWLDSAIVSINSFTILKLYEDSYNILVVPSTNN
ncbi:MAG: hypothetical protein IJ093_01570, partial [Bacilli bacterium]|nr:hypothetical protein [Bacilli bacterium]